MAKQPVLIERPSRALVRDLGQRQLLFELGEAITALESQGGSPETLLRLRACQGNLLRMWIES